MRIIILSMVFVLLITCGKAYAEVDEIYDATLQSGFNWNQYAQEAAAALPEGNNIKTKFDTFDQNNLDSYLFRYLHSYSVSNALYVAAVSKDRKSFFTCGDRYDIDIGKVTIIEPIEFLQGHKDPYKGVWKHQYKITRCGTERVYNIYALANPKAEPHFISAPMGYTLLNLKELSYLLPRILKEMAEYHEQMSYCDTDSCLKSIVVTNSTNQIQDILDNAKPGEYGNKAASARPQYWSEVWNIYACGRITSFTLDFSASIEKTTFTMKYHRES